MSGFYEVWEHYQYGTKAERFVELKYHSKTPLTVRGEIPRTHGISYKFMRDQFKNDFGEVMGLDLLFLEPDTDYKDLVALTRNLE